MSVDLVVYLQRASMPTPKQWADGIRATGFPVDLEFDFDPDTATGFRPCKYAGVLSGFEYYSGRLSSAECRELAAPSSCDFLVTFTTGSDLREFATSLIAASVLSQMSNGTLLDPQEGVQYPASDVLAWARKQLASFKADIK
jgi:hypothetical protein